MSMIFVFIKDQDKVRLQHNNHVVVYLTLLGSCTTKEYGKTGPAFHTYVQRKLDNITTIAEGITKEEISPQLDGSHKDFRINPFFY